MVGARISQATARWRSASSRRASSCHSWSSACGWASCRPARQPPCSPWPPGRAGHPGHDPGRRRPDRRGQHDGARARLPVRGGNGCRHPRTLGVGVDMVGPEDLSNAQSRQLGRPSTHHEPDHGCATDPLAEHGAVAEVGGPRESRTIGAVPRRGQQRNRVHGLVDEHSPRLAAGAALLGCRPRALGGTPAVAHAGARARMPDVGASGLAPCGAARTLNTPAVRRRRRCSAQAP